MFYGSRNSVALLILAVLWSIPSYGLLSTEIEPIIGYEREQKLVPTPHTKDRMVYGARAIVGFLILGAEAEYLRGQDTEDFPTLSFSTKDTSDKLKLGIRSTFRMGGLFALYLRAGGQATQSVHEETASGVTTVETKPLVYRPYAGVGLRAKLTKRVSVVGDITAVFSEYFPNGMDRNEYQTSLGFSVKFP